jgi:[NiFe] hydrogenase small subunit
MPSRKPGPEGKLERRELGRREFVAYCGKLAAMLGLATSAIPDIARALTSGLRPPVIWLELADCTGCTEAFLRSASPWIDDLILGKISLEYHEALMAPSGAGAEASLETALATYAGEYLCIVEGAIPTAQGGVFGMIGGRTMLSLAQAVCAQAKAVVAVGTCSAYGGLPAAAPNPTGAKGVKDALGITTINIPGCPPNPLVLDALLVNYLLAGTFPAVDSYGRPVFAYAATVHGSCPRNRNSSSYVRGSGPCLESRGCRGSSTCNTCPTQKFNMGTSWCVQVDYPCIGCSEPGFWERGGFYDYAGGE